MLAAEAGNISRVQNVMRRAGLKPLGCISAIWGLKDFKPESDMIKFAFQSGDCDCNVRSFGRGQNNLTFSERGNRSHYDSVMQGITRFICHNALLFGGRRKGEDQ